MIDEIIAVHISISDFQKVKKLLEAANLEIKFVVEQSEKTSENLRLGIDKFM